MNDIRKVWGLLIGAISLNAVQATVATISTIIVAAYTIWKWRKESKK